MAQTNVQVFSGNVGIGTTGPAGKLHVETPLGTSTNFVKIGSSLNSGSSQSVSGIEFAGNPAFFNGDNTQRSAAQITSGFYEGGTADWADAYISLRTPNNPSTGTLNDILTIRGGNIGINTTGPAYPLHIMSDTVPQVWIEGAVNTDAVLQSGSGPSYRNTYHRIRFKHYALAGDAFKAQNSINFEVSPGGLAPVSAMTINGWGRVGIGTDTPVSPLYVKTTTTGNARNSAVLTVKGDIGGNDISASQHRVQLRIENYQGAFSNRALGLGVLDNGTGTIQASTGNEGYFPLILNPIAGSVGIGTTNPVAKLNIQGTSEGAPPTSGGDGTSNGIFRLRDNFNVALDIGTLGASPWTTWLQVADTTTMSTGYPLSLNPNGGNVGIRTTNPGYVLDVNGATRVGQQLYVGPNSPSQTSPNTLYFGGLYGDYGYENCVIENRIWQAGSEKREMLLFSGNDTGGASGSDRIRLRGNTILFDTYPTATTDRTAESVRMIIAQDGKVGIGLGTSNPGFRIEVHTTDNHIGDFSTTNTSGYIAARNNSGTRCYLGADGNGYISQEQNSGGIYMNNNGNINFFNNGARRAYLSSGGVFHAQGFGIYSDERIKDNITDVNDEESLEIIKQLQPKNFVMRENRDVKRWGFIANDVEQFLPEAVSSDSTSKVYIKKRYEIISYNPPVKLSDVVYSNVSVTEYATLDANTQAHYTGPYSGNTYYSNIVSEAVYSKSNVSARITDEVFDIGDCIQLSDDETYSLNVCCVHVVSVSNNVYVFQDDCRVTADDKDLTDINLTDYIYVKSKDIDNVKTINYEFMNPTLISAVQQIIRNIDRLTERVTILENT